MKPLRNLIFHRYFLSVEFFRGPHLVHFRWNPWEVWSYIVILWVWNFSKVHTLYIFDETLRSLVFHRYFLNVEFFRGLYILQYSSMKLYLRSLIFHRYFLSVEFFRGPHLVHFRRNFWEVSIFHRCFLNVDFFRSSHLVYFDETFEKFDLSSIFSKSGIFQRSILRTFRCDPWKFDLSSIFFSKSVIFLEIHT